MQQDGNPKLTRQQWDRSIPISVQIYAILRDDIVTLRRPPGSPLSDKAISAELQVSRTPVREAFLRLADEELVEVFPNSGTFVTKIQTRALRNSQFVRRALECAVVRDAARTITPDGLAKLRTILSKQARQAPDNPASFYRLDELFHQRLFEISDHAEAWPVAVRAKAQLDRVRYISVAEERRFQAVIDEHHRVVDALATGDADAAVDALAGHLDSAFLRLDQTVRIYSTYFTPDPSDLSSSAAQRQRRPALRAGRSLNSQGNDRATK